MLGLFLTARLADFLTADFGKLFHRR